MTTLQQGHMPPRTRRWTSGMNGRVAIALAFTLAVPGAMLAAQDDSATVPGAEDAAAQAAQLATSLRSELSAFNADTPVETVEAAVIFAVNQGQYPDSVINAAFDQVLSGPGITDNIRQAIENVRRRLGRLGRGTGALGGGDGAFGPIGFNAPALGGGGGGSNYTQ
jgi:hypothetical protein